MLKDLIAGFLVLFMCIPVVGCTENDISKNDALNNDESSNKVILSNHQVLSDSELFAGDIAINEKIITFPCKLSQLEKDFTIIEESSSSENRKCIVLIDEDGTEIRIVGDFNEKTEDEMYFHQITVTSDNMNVFFPKGLKIGIPRSEVEEIFKGYTNTIDPDKDYSYYAEIELSDELLWLPFTSSYSIGSKYKISYDSNGIVEEITYSSKPHVENEIYYYSKSCDSSDGAFFSQLPLALGMDGDNAAYRFAIYYYEEKNYIIRYNRCHYPSSFKFNDTSEQGIVDEITEYINSTDWTSNTVPKIQHNTDLVRSAVAFGDDIRSFTKSQISIGDSKTVEYPVHKAVVIYGFGKTFVTDKYEIFSADYTEIPQSVIEKFENIVNEAAKNLKY